MERRRNWRRILLVGFFLFMLVCTLISRIYDSVSVPKVLTVFPKRKSVETIISGTGTVREIKTAFCSVYPGIRIESVAVSPGSQVKTGDELFRYQMSSLAEKKEELETELQKVRLSLERINISSETYGQVSQAELAARELQLSQQELEQGRQDHEAKWEEHLANLEDLKTDYEKKKKMSDIDLMIQQEQQMNSVYGELRSARESRNEEIQAVKREIEDLKAELEAAGGSDSELEKQLVRANEDLAELEHQWKNQISDIEDHFNILEYQNQRIRKGETSGQQALKETYEAAVKQENEAWQAEEEALEALEKNAADAQWNLDVAVRQDEYIRLTEEQKARLAEIDRRMQELDMESLEKEISNIDTLIAAEGVTAADRDGTVIHQELAAGKTGTGEERLSIAYGNRQFEAEFDKEGQELSVGDLLSIDIPGSTRSVETKIDSLNLLGEDTGTLRANLEDLDLPVGTVTSFQCRKVSEPYQSVIPLEALRKDMMGYYCLAVRSRSAVLGEEFWAERVELTVLQMGDQEAAVDGAILESDRLVSAANQIINAGDRVRPVEDLGQ